MLRVVALPFLALLLQPGQCFENAGPTNPVTQVVQLLKGLSTKIEKEGKEEEDLYYSFVCWGKSIIDQKTASNKEGKNRIDYLTTYIADIEAGRIEFTSERVDLEKEISTLMEDMETATAIREKEAMDYETAKNEMEKAITALNSALDVLKEATKDAKTGVMLTGLKVRSGAQTSVSSQVTAMTRAVQLGNRYLNKGDAFFLQRLLTGEVPTWDWKKLNRKATFKMSYKARSFKIQDVLTKLLETFTTNLQDATAKENEAKAIFDKLMDSKGQEADAAKTALLKLEGETGAAGMSKADAQAELDDLTQQVADDTKFIAQTEKDLADKKAEWKTRYTLRTAELAAISKAISILYADDARDLFKNSFASQGKTLFFLQEESLTATRSASDRRAAANAVIKKSMTRMSTMQPNPLTQVSNQLQAGTQFDAVITAIDNMVATLVSEENSDLKNKEDCEKDRMDDTREAVLQGRAIDDFTETIVRLRAEIAEINDEIAKTNETVQEIIVDLAEALKVRNAQNAEFLKDKQDDVDAKAVVISAKNVLSNFYQNNNLQTVFQQQPQTVAGEAPPPPPKTWDGAYGGSGRESGGIIAILGMISEDIQRDIDKAIEEEAQSLAAYNAATKKMNTEKTNLENSITTLTGTRTTKQGEVTSTKTQRKTKKGLLDATMTKIEGAEDGCNYFTINYERRLKDRQIEIDGLKKAKAILQGAVFDAPDPNREIKPGDALVQIRRH